MKWKKYLSGTLAFVLAASVFGAARIRRCLYLRLVLSGGGLCCISWFDDRYGHYTFCTNGIITGKNGISLDPQGTSTRGEAAAVVQRFVEAYK